MTPEQAKGSPKIDAAVKYSMGAGSSDAGKGSVQRTYGEKFASNMEEIQKGEVEDPRVECQTCGCNLSVESCMEDRRCICGERLFFRNGSPTIKAKLL